VAVVEAAEHSPPQDQVVAAQQASVDPQSSSTGLVVVQAAVLGALVEPALAALVVLEQPEVITRHFPARHLWRRSVLSTFRSIFYLAEQPDPAAEEAPVELTPSVELSSTVVLALFLVWWGSAVRETEIRAAPVE